MDVSVEQIGICENEKCREILYMGEMKPHQVVGSKCEWCQHPITWKSLGYESVGGVYDKVKWVGPGVKWVNQKPVDSFFLGHYCVIPETSLALRGNHDILLQKAHRVPPEKKNSIQGVVSTVVY